MQNLRSWVRLYQTPTGRRLFAHRGVLLVVDELLPLHPELGRLKTHLGEAIGHDEHTASLELVWASVKANDRVEGEARELDVELDRLLRNLHDVVSVIARSPVKAMPIDAATKILTELFPAGVAAITQTSHEQQTSTAAILLKRLEGDLAPEAQRLGLAPYLPPLRELVAQLKVELTRRPKEKLSYDVVRAAQRQGQELYLETAVRILGAFPSQSDADRKTRGALLTPIWRQNEDLRIRRQRRRPPVDVDPTTGETGESEE